MKTVPLSVRLTVAFGILSVVTLTEVYFGFSHLVEEHLKQVEREKAALIVATIEPLVAMSAYLGLADDIAQVASQTMRNPQVRGLHVYLDDTEVWRSDQFEVGDHVQVSGPIRDPVSQHAIGRIDLIYATQSLAAVESGMHRQIVSQLLLMTLGFVLYVVIVRHFLKPLAVIAERVKAYHPSQVLNFSGLRMTPETEAIALAFGRMVENVREYNVMLERYKQAVDEGAIVSRLNPAGEITYINDEFCRVSGYSRRELIGTQCDFVGHPDNDPGLYAEIWRVLTAKQIWKGTLKNRTKDGLSYYVKASIVPILDEQDAIIEHIAIQYDITQIVRQREQISRQTTDLMTGLPNRVRLQEDVKNQQEPKLAMISVDNYSVIRDYYGQEAANRTLIGIGGRLQNLVSGYPVCVYKLASSDYGLLASDKMELGDFQESCRRVIEEINDSPLTVDGESFDFNISAGISNNPAQLMSYASLALKYAQETHQSMVIYEQTENLIRRYENNLIWTKRIKQALQDGRIALFAQPIIDARSMQVVKYECLVRLIEVDGQVVSPYHFLDVAKKSKLYHKISRRVLDTTIDMLLRMPDKTFSVNLSPDDLMHAPTMALLRRRLDDPRLASRLVVEIVESEEIEQFSVISENLAELKRLGCQVAIDDFGTGYSNYAYLMRLHIDCLKVDGSLIRDIDSNQHSQVICNTIIDFARQLELKTVAEFVHSEPVMHKVCEMGFDYLQGYLLGEPAPATDLLAEPLAASEEGQRRAVV